MRGLYFYIFLVLGNSLYCQNNNSVIEAKLLLEQGETEKSLKKGLNILLSKEELTPTDSFYTYQTLAYSFYEFKAYDPALGYAKKAIEINERTNKKSRVGNKWMSQFYSAVEQYDSAVVYMKKDIESAISTKDTTRLLTLYNNIGWAYYRNAQKDSATSYYAKIITLKNAKNYPVHYGMAMGNYGLILFEDKEYKDAIPYFEVDAKLNKEELWGAYFGAMNRIAECYFYMEQYKKAEQSLLRVTDVEGMGIEQKLKRCKLFASVYQKMQQPAKSAEYLRQCLSLKEEIESEKIPTEAILKELSNAKINEIQADLALTKKELDLLDEQLSTKTLRNQFYIISLILLLTMGVMYMFFYRSRQKRKKAILKLENDLLAADVKNKNNDLNNFGTNLTYKRKFIDDIQTRLKKIQKQPTKDLNENITLLIREFNNYKSSDKNVEVIQADVEKVNTSFFNKLGEQFPLLTEKEKELCGLLMLNLSSKDIANIRNVSPNAIKKARQRIRKKLPISENQRLALFLEAL